MRDAKLSSLKTCDAIGVGPKFARREVSKVSENSDEPDARFVKLQASSDDCSNAPRFFRAVASKARMVASDVQIASKTRQYITSEPRR